MPLTSGTKLGPYEIQSPLGAGGMGEVYRARDTRLDRTVAVKVLASHLSSSPELKQRMEREGRAISSLNHPHICQLYDIGSQNGTDYLVMEFLEGETLAERLRKGAMPLNELLKIGIAIAEALAVAHRNGIVHRDLKPGNIMLTAGGAKLMDFGLAKPLSAQTTAPGSGTQPPSFTAAATLSGPSPLSPLTTAGSIVGTIQYMAPEQIEGKEADARSDIFAFGAVLYEMVAGKRPFSGKSQISLASSILEADPQLLVVLKPQTPPAFDHVVTTCLQKDPEQRYLAAHDIKLELQWIAADRSSSSVAGTPAAAPANRWERLSWAVAVVAAVVIGGIAGVFLAHPAPSNQITRTMIDAPPKATLDLTGDFAGPPVLSPDGALMAFVATGAEGKTAIWIRPMNVVEARMLPGTDGAIFPFWSPDGHSLGFFADSKLKTIDINGGSAIVICEAQFGRGGSWGPGGVIVFTPGTQTVLMRVSAGGGTPTPLTKLDPTQHTSHRWPFFLPDGRHYVYLAINHDPSHATNDALFYASLDGKENRMLFRSQSNAVYGSGFLLFARGDQLMAQAFDPNNGTLAGEPQTLAGGVVDDVSTWHIDASASNNGMLVLGSGGTADWQLVWTDRNGKQIGTVADKLTNLQTAVISPQGDRVALQIDNGVNDIWVFDLARGIKTRLTFGPVSNIFPVWSPDGRWIAYNSDRNGRANILRKRSDGSGVEELLLTDPDVAIPTDWSRDGKTLIYTRGAIGSNSEIWAMPFEGDRKPFLVLAHTANSFLAQGMLSPNARWLAYTSTESGNPEVYVTAFGGGQGKWQVSTNEGTHPKWSNDGKELYFANNISRVLSSVPVKEENGALQFGAGQPVATTPATQQFIYDVSPDDKKILLNVVSQQVNQSITVVSNFTAGLKK
ncbi:MAG TPA: protein kinase [Candidatus Acidoferrum sp.]|jgi:Tol biopolymer transport system component|nr:protein kinase [Candidatus Acidoferrum sp.]